MARNAWNFAATSEKGQRPELPSSWLISSRGPTVINPEKHHYSPAERGDVELFLNPNVEPSQVCLLEIAEKKNLEDDANFHQCCLQPELPPQECYLESPDKRNLENDTHIQQCILQPELPATSIVDYCGPQSPVQESHVPLVDGHPSQLHESTTDNSLAQEEENTKVTPGAHGALCPTCNKFFKNTSNLRKHIRSVHHREKNHRCPWGCRGFNTSTDLKRHQRSAHLRELLFYHCHSQQCKPVMRRDLFCPHVKESEDGVVPKLELCTLVGMSWKECLPRLSTLVSLGDSQYLVHEDACRYFQQSPLVPYSGQLGGHHTTGLFLLERDQLVDLILKGLEVNKQRVGEDCYLDEQFWECGLDFTTTSAFQIKELVRDWVRRTSLLSEPVGPYRKRHRKP